MSLIHADNFNIYGSTASEMTAAGRYSENGGCALVTDPDGISTPKVLRLQGGFPGTTNLRRALKTPTTKVGIGMRVWVDNLPSSTAKRPILFFWHDSSNRGMARILLQTTGALLLQVFDTTSGAFGDWYDVAETTGPVMTSGAWWQIEAMFDTAGPSCEVRVEGVEKINATSGDFGTHLHNGPNIYQCGLYSNADGSGFFISCYFKDYFWWDGLGTDNIDFLGPCLVAELDPDGDVDVGYWVPSTGSAAWSILDNNPADTPYLAGDNTLGDPVECTQTNLPPDITTIKGIVSIVRAKKVDGGDGQIQVSLGSVGSYSDGEDRPITAAWTDWEDIHERDPHTSAAWLPAAVDASTIKINRTV